MWMNYCWVFHSSINNLYYYNKTTSFQQLFIEYCIRHPLCTSSSPLFLTCLFVSSVRHPLAVTCPCRAAHCFSVDQKLWDSGVPWASPMHAPLRNAGKPVRDGGWQMKSLFFSKKIVLRCEFCTQQRVVSWNQANIHTENLFLSLLLSWHFLHQQSSWI